MSAISRKKVITMRWFGRLLCRFGFHKFDATELTYDRFMITVCSRCRWPLHMEVR